jgi:uncharacterized membrane protein
VNEFLKENFPKLAGYKGRILCSLVGFVAGLLWVFMGFWRTVAFILCIIIGYYLGKKIDQRFSVREFINKIFPPSD